MMKFGMGVVLSVDYSCLKNRDNDFRVVPRARLGGQTTTNVLVSALVSDCTNVLAKCRSILPKVLLLKSS